MAKAYRIPDYRAVYPEADEEVIAVLRTTERKMQYQEYDLKTERIIISKADQRVTVIPGREETVLRRIEYGRLYQALALLSDDERELIERLYFQEQTERETAVQMGIYHNAVHKRKNRILKKLKKILEKI